MNEVQIRLLDVTLSCQIMEVLWVLQPMMLPSLAAAQGGM